jgi:hypothetical protein
MPLFDPPERRPIPHEPPTEEEPPNPVVDHADADDDPDADEVEIVDTDEFGEPIDESVTDDDADDKDPSEI